ncbi:MAG: 2-oxoacid:acceptor oxidoreductase family protein [bacterium]
MGRNFRKMVEAPAESRYILQGNEAFALGVVHAGFHAADGYPGTPSTEVIDKSLKHVQDKMHVGWSVNEAVATSVALGHSVAGFDSVVTLKVPGLFQAGDAVSTSATFTGKSGAFVLFVAADYVPSSTQHVIDARYFFSSARVPVLEPRNHQEMYEIAWHAADISKKFNTQVAVLASGILTHSEGLVVTKEPRTIKPRELPENLHDWMLMPNLARKNYIKSTTERVPGVEAFTNTDEFIDETDGSSDFGIITVGESDIIVREALNTAGLEPSILSMSIANPVPRKRIKNFAEKIDGPLFIFEDGDKFLQEKTELLGIKVHGKSDKSTITDWKPDMVLSALSEHMNIDVKTENSAMDVKPVPRPPSICPGCPYRAFGLTVKKLRRKKKIYASFGEIGCSTLLYFLEAVDTILCMGGSDGMRQGFTISRPDMAQKTISVIGDSCECHSGLDATRNAVFRNNAGVKVVLDNRITAMTGGQPAPTSEKNLAGENNKFDLEEAEKAEKCRTVKMNAYNMDIVEKELAKALELAEKGEYSVLILEGACIQETPAAKKLPRLSIDRDKCKKCHQCDICPGIAFGEDGYPYHTSMCTNCGSNISVCMQSCPFDAIKYIEKDSGKTAPPELPKVKPVKSVSVNKKDLPDSLRLAIRGIGGQGNLFFGKVLSELAMRLPYSETNIVKGDTHGMAQLGGPVISTFSCGNVFSPVLTPGSTDILVAMESSEILREGFLELLKPGGRVILNKFKAVPVTARNTDYPEFSDIKKALSSFDVIETDALGIVTALGDTSGKTANVAVLGILSTLSPFDSIPEEIWLDAIMSVSPGDTIKSANQLAFSAGRKKGSEI